MRFSAYEYTKAYLYTHVASLDVYGHLNCGAQNGTIKYVHGRYADGGWCPAIGGQQKLVFPLWGIVAFYIANRCL
jgi:hypothetical protein